MATGQAPEAARQDTPAREARTLPFSKPYAIGFSAAMFLTGVAGAMLYSFRRRPAAALNEALDSGAARPGGVVRTLTSEAFQEAPAPEAELGARAPEAPRSSIDEAASQGPLSLFREMNAAIFRKNKAGAPARPGVSALRAAPQEGAPAVVRDSSAVSSAIRAPAAGAVGAFQKKAPAPAPSASLQDAPQPQDEGVSGPVLALGAFGLATAIVGVGATAVVAIVRQTLDVTTVEEFADKMHALMPSIEWRPAWVTRLVNVPQEDESTPPVAPAAPLPIHEAIHRLDHAQDPLEWFQIARQQLDAEEARHRAERAHRLASRRQ